TQAPTDKQDRECASCAANTVSVGPNAASCVAITAGEKHTCFLDTGSGVSCWGDSTNDRTAPPSGTFVAIDAGSDYACGIIADGTVRCWGNSVNKGSQAPSGVQFSSISIGGSHGCGIRASDDQLECWQGDGPRYEPPSGAFKSVSSGLQHSCAISATGFVQCWGEGTYALNARPSSVSNTTPIASVTNGYLHNCLVLELDKVPVCWGQEPDVTGRPATGVASIELGESHGCALLAADGRLACWGGPPYDYGQASPPSISFRQVAAGRFHTCGIDD